MNPKLTDQAVSELPLAAARAHLLEEIMSTPVIDTVAHEPTRRQQHRRWLMPVAAAVTVLAVATTTAWWAEGGSAPAPEPVPAAPVSPVAPVAPPAAQEAGYRAVLDAPGWKVENVEDDPRYGGSIAYSSGRESLEVSWSPGDSYEDYVADREHIVEPPAPGEPVEVLGADAQLWAYSADDHTVIREVERGHWLEVRGSGMTRATYLELLTTLRLVDQAGFDAALPRSFVVSGDSDTAATTMMEEIFETAGARLPAGVAEFSIRSNEPDPYHLGADVAGAVACAWIGEYVAAVAAGDTARADEAVRVLGTSRQWPVLRTMVERGDYSDVVWDYADRVAAGDVPESYEGGLGC